MEDGRCGMADGKNEYLKLRIILATIKSGQKSE